MGESTTIEILDEIIKVLRANLTDPIKNRSNQGKPWIVSELPTYSLGTPYIKVSFISSNLDPLAIGSTGYRQLALYQATIVTKKGESKEIDGVKLNHLELAEYFAGKIITTTKTISNFSKPWRLRVENQNNIPTKGCNYFMTLDLYALFER